jgi:predicted MFS family arabinose efflux permease
MPRRRALPHTEEPDRTAKTPGVLFAIGLLSFLCLIVQGPVGAVGLSADPDALGCAADLNMTALRVTLAGGALCGLVALASVVWERTGIAAASFGLQAAFIVAWLAFDGFDAAGCAIG